MVTDHLKTLLKAGDAPTIPPGLRTVDPAAIRAKLMLETASHMMTERDWPYRKVTINIESQGDEMGAFRMLGANNPDSIRQVFERKLDISIMNPGAILSMAHQGLGLFSEPMQVALIAVIPHEDQLAFAVSESSGLKSLDDIRDRRFPLRLSVRGSSDLCTTRLVEKILNVHGFGYEDIVRWGGHVSYDQPMPSQTLPSRPSRIDRVVTGELDAIFEEGVDAWINQALTVGMRLLSIAETRLSELRRIGFKPRTLEKSRYERLPGDINVVDFSGWPIYTRVDAPNLLIRKFCEALEARKDSIPSNFGPLRHDPLPLSKMVVDSPATPVDLPFHPAAREIWWSMGYLK
ncbi:MAG: hypothetical protein QOF09_2923 [Alphaproteobacteria bacterium]|nr:hypothetical protein [Alphaproteobacteria bacterium]